ncbi:MAG: hypothetical protein IT473_03055 [Lysobacter sp.]|nr:hypothetical protein [Lysobacter sp.]
MNRSFEPLSPEERALAERLSRLDAHREPAPALDAAILAAARAAVKGEKTVEPIIAAAAAPALQAAAPAPEAANDAPASTVVPTRPRKPMSRWPLGLSLAASLVLAAGIGWRLADGGGSEAALEAAAEKSMPMSDDSFASADAVASEESVEAVILEPEMNRTPPPPPPPPLVDAELRRRDVAAAAPIVQNERKSADTIQDSDRRFEMDEAVAHDGAAADASAFPAEQAAKSAPTGGAASSVGYTAAKPERTNAEGLAAGRAKDERETAKSDRGEALDRVQTLGTRNAARSAPAAPAAAPAPAPVPASAAADQPYDDQPPVSADSPQFRQAWLQRIRNLLAKGETEAGHNSLQEFRRRYPDSELPEDLKKVAATLPPPTP